MTGGMAPGPLDPPLDGIIQIQGGFCMSLLHLFNAQTAAEEPY